MRRAAARLACVVTAVLCVAAGSGRASAQVRDWPSEKPPPPKLSPPPPFPPYDVRTLPNGLRVVVVRQTEQPVVSLQLLVRAGSAADPAGKAGLANLTALVLTQGAGTRTARAIAEAVDDAGAELTVSSATDAVFAQVTVVKDGLDTALDLLADIACRPTFPGIELERQRQQVGSALKVSYADPAYLSAIVFNRLVFGTHGYGMPTDGTPDSVAGITREDLTAFHARYYVPNNAMIAVVGDVDVDVAIAGVLRAFGAWVPGRLTAPPPPVFPAPERRVVVIDKPDATAAEIRMGQRVPGRRDAAYLATDLAVRILGGEGGNRLQRVLRNQRGLTYAAAARHDTLAHTGVVRAETTTTPPAVGEAVRLIVEQFSELRRERVTGEELAAVQAFVRGSVPMGLEAPGAISTRVLLAMFHEFPFRELETHVALSDGVTVDHIYAAIQANVMPDRLTTVVVGPSGWIVPALRAVGFKDVDVIPAAQLDVAAPTLKRGGPVSSVVASAGVAGRLATKNEWEAAHAVVARAAEAAGGFERLKQIKTLSATARTTLYTPTGPVRAETKTLIAYPDQLRVDAITPQGVVVQVYDAGHAWMWETRGGHRDAPDVVRRDFEAALRRDWIRLVADVFDGRVSGRRVADESAAGDRPLHVVELWSAQLPPVRLAVDAATGRLERISYRVPGPFGAETFSETYSDFRTVAGVLIPFQAVVRRDEAPVLERAVLDLKVNPVLAAGVFTKPK